MPAITLSKSNNREIKINERANLNLPLCTGERFKKKGHAGILKGLSLQEPSVVSRAEVLQHSRAVARMWGPLCPPSSPQPREPLWGMQVQQRVQVCRCAHLGLNTCGGVSNPSGPLHSPEGGGASQHGMGTAARPGAPALGAPFCVELQEKNSRGQA